MAILIWAFWIFVAWQIIETVVAIYVTQFGWPESPKEKPRRAAQAKCHRRNEWRYASRHNR